MNTLLRKAGEQANALADALAEEDQLKAEIAFNNVLVFLELLTERTDFKIAVKPAYIEKTKAMIE